MKISGNASLQAPVEQVWTAIQDPAVLARVIPGCETLTPTGANQYDMAVSAGVAAIKGTYTGTVALADLVDRESFTLKASGAGAPGTISTDVKVRLAPGASGGTEVSYDADAIVGGAIGGVGQRMLTGVARKMAGQLFANIDHDIATGGAQQSSAEPAPAAADAGTQASTAASSAPASYSGRNATANANAALTMDSAAGFAVGVGVGGLLALAGVALGARIARRG